MEAFVWLGAGRTDSNGSAWPEAGELHSDGCALPGFQLLVDGVADELWRVEFEGDPKLGADGLEGPARLVSSLSAWSSALAGALRLQLFELARGTLARALVSVDSPEWPNALSRDVMLDAGQVGRKVATSRAPVELLQTLEKVKPIVSELWPPQKKRGLFASKVDATRVYELLRKALESLITATEEITQGVNSPELIPSLNSQIAAASRLAKADLMFGAMLRASAASNQETLETMVDDARDKTKALREIESGPAGHAGLSGGFSFTATDGFRSADPDRGHTAELPLPDAIKTLTAWLGDRLDINVAEIDLGRLSRAGAAAAATASGAVERAPVETPLGTPSVSVAAKAAGHAHDQEPVDKSDLLRHVEQVHGQKADMFGEIALRRFHDEAHRAAARLDEAPGVGDDRDAATPAASPEPARASRGSVKKAEEPTIEILPPGSIGAPVVEPRPERETRREPAAAQTSAPKVEAETKTEVEPLAAAAAEAARSVAEPEASEIAEATSDSTDEQTKSRPKPEPRAKPKPAAVKPEPKPAPQREVVVVPNSPAGLEMAAPGPTEPSAPERAAAAASAKQTPGRSYPPPLAAHTHDSPIWGHDDLLRHVEIIHGVPVGTMEPDALQAIHDATHAND
jgi:hypothetical protein